MAAGELIKVDRHIECAAGEGHDLMIVFSDVRNEWTVSCLRCPPRIWQLNPDGSLTEV